MKNVLRVVALALVWGTAGAMAQEGPPVVEETPEGDAPASAEVETPAASPSQPGADVAASADSPNEVHPELAPAVRAELIENLLAGEEFEPIAPPETLFAINLEDTALVGEGADALNATFALLSDPPRRLRRPEDDYERLRRALVNVLLLSDADRSALTRNYEEAYRARQQELANVAARAEAASTLVQTRARYLDDALTARRDPSAIRNVSLGQDEGVAALFGLLENGATREQLREVQTQAQGLSPARDAELRRNLELRLRALEAQGIEEEIPIELDETERARAEALAEARRAANEQGRRVSEERARLFGIRTEQAEFRTSMTEAQMQAEAFHDQIAGLIEQTNALDNRSVLDGDKTVEAERLYLRAARLLGEARQKMYWRLRQLQAPNVPPGPGEDPIADIEDGREGIDSLREELLSEVADLRLEVDVARRQRAETLDHDLASLNESRLLLLTLSGPDLQSDVRGFGADGVRQAQAEASQINLSARYGAATLQRRVSQILSDLRTSPVPLILGVVKFLFVLFLFRWWRRRADTVLQEYQESESGGMFARMAGYLRRIRSPLEWLLLAWVILKGSALANVPGTQLLFSAFLWICGARIVIGLMDAMAKKRHRRRERPVDRLRLRSLRLIGLVIAAVGLLLDWTQILVGKGAIYGWVITLCWILVLPIIVVMVRWWRPHIWQIIEARPKDDTIANTLRGRSTNLLWTAVAGGYASWLGLMRFGVGMASRLDGTRALRAHLLRRQVARRAEEDSANREPINKLLYRRLDPERGAEKPLTVNHGGVDEILDMGAPAVAVVVAPRGGGKTTQMARIGDKAGGVVVALRGPRSAASVLEQLRERLDSPDAPLEELLGDKKLTVLIDDAHQLAQPAIGGLNELDELLHTAREVGGLWVLAFDQWAWQYVSRARAASVFDRVHQLPAWEDAAIVSLLDSRSEQADISPSFSGLVLPRQIDSDEEEDPSRTYFRMLADVSGGNPALALQFWRESLFVENEQTVVRLFREPSDVELENLATTVRYVLRTVLQLDWAREEEIVVCSDLPAEDVRDAIRLAIARGYLKKDADGFRIAWPWYRPITGVLTRLNVLVSP